LSGQSSGDEAVAGQEPTARIATLRVDSRLLELLICPVSKGPLEFSQSARLLLSRKAGLAYPIRDGIPIMLPDEASTIPIE